MRIRLSAVVIVALCVSGCAGESELESGPALTDAELQEVVKTRLQGDESISRLDLDVTADADANAVQLEGTAYTQMQRTRAVEIARSASPGVAVQDKIDVKPYEIPRDLFDEEMMAADRADASKMGDKVGDAVDDGWLHMKVVAKLIADTDTPQRQINVDVQDNVVTLRGNVPTRESRTQAETIARGVEGVKDVRNRLAVKP